MQPDFFDQFNEFIMPKLMETPIFSRRYHHIDWKVIASIDLEELVQSYDFDILNKLLPYIVFCNIASEFTEIDPLFLKLYRLAQIIIEYFIQSQLQFTQLFSALQNKYDQLNSRFQILITDAKENKQILKQIRTKSRSQKNNCMQLQTVKLDNQSHFSCKYCGKHFYTQEFLSKHIVRRHHDIPFNKNLYTRESPSHIVGDVSLDSTKIKEHNIEHPNEDSQNKIGLFRLINERIFEHTSTLEQGLQKRVLEQESIHRDYLQKIKQESERNENEFNLFKQSILSKIRDQGVQHLRLENALEGCQEFINEIRLTNRSSNLGELEDESLNISSHSQNKCDDRNQDHACMLQTQLDRENIGMLISQKLTNELANLQRQLRLEQTEWLRVNSIEALTYENSFNISTEERFERFKSEILDILSYNQNQGYNKTSSEIHNNDSHTLNIPVNSQLEIIPVKRKFKEEIETKFSADNDVKEIKGNTSSLEFDPKVLPFFTNSQKAITSPIHFQTISERDHSLTSNSQFSQIQQNNLISENSLELHHSITTLKLNRQIPLESIFFNERRICSFLPFPKKCSLLKSNFPLELSELVSHRNEFSSLLMQELSNNCILPNHYGLPISHFNSLMNKSKSVQETFSIEHPDFYTIRKIIEKDLKILMMGSFDIKLLSKLSISQSETVRPTLVLDSLKNMPEHINPSISVTCPASFESPTIYSSDILSSLSSPVIEADGYNFKVPHGQKKLHNTSWDSDNSELEQGYNNLLSEFTGKDSPLSNSVVTVDQHGGPITKMHSENELQGGSIPSDFSLSDVTAENSELTNNADA